MRNACADLLPPALVWRKKAQFDEGSGTVDTLAEALKILGAGDGGPVTREQEAALYEKILRERFAMPERILAAAGRWDSDARVAV